MTVNACISATRVACEFFQAFDIPVEPVSTKFVVEVPAMKLAYTSGLSEEELATAKDSRRAFGRGWNGHLIARVARNWLIDPGFNQIAAPEALGPIIGLDLNHEPIPIFPLTDDATDSFHVEYGCVSGNGLELTVHYITTNDTAWRKTEAWNDAGLSWLASEIMVRVRQDIEAMNHG